MTARRAGRAPALQRALRPAARRRRRRADSPGRSRAWDWRSRTPDSDRRRTRGDSLALLGLAAAAQISQQPAQQKGPLRAVEDRDESLVHGWIGDERAQRALALVDLRGDLLEIGERRLQIARGLADAGVGRLVLDEAAERALAADQAIRDLAEVVRDDLEVLEHVLVLRVEQQRRHQPLVRAARLLGHARELLHRGHEAPRRGRRLIGGQHARRALAALDAVEQALRGADHLGYV